MLNLARKAWHVKTVTDGFRKPFVPCSTSNIVTILGNSLVVLLVSMLLYFLRP